MVGYIKSQYRREENLKRFRRESLSKMYISTKQSLMPFHLHALILMPIYEPLKLACIDFLSQAQSSLGITKIIKKLVQNNTYIPSFRHKYNRDPTFIKAVQKKDYIPSVTVGRWRMPWPASHPQLNIQPPSNSVDLSVAKYRGYILIPDMLIGNSN